MVKILVKRNKKLTLAKKYVLGVSPNTVAFPSKNKNANVKWLLEWHMYTMCDKR